MKTQRTFFRLISIVCALSLFAVQPGFAATKSVNKLKSAGRTANSIPNTILNGVQAPLKSVGINGDFYIDTKNLNIYGPKKNNAWPLPISLRGTAGVAGTDGRTGTPGVAGTDGKTITNTSTVSGSAGATGATGATGITGPAGSTGPAGASGSAGPAGPPGPAGSTGATGSTGASGSSGASGVTTASVGVFNFSNAFTGTPGSSGQSENFGTLRAGGKYLMHLNISGYSTSSSDLDSTLALEVFSTAGAIPITCAYSVSSGKKFTGGATSFSQNIIADLLIDGSLVTNTFDLYVKVSATEMISYTVTLNGYFSYTEVGSIT